jgi:predicted RNA-binding Zn ribbon-like protein
VTIDHTSVPGQIAFGSELVSRIEVAASLVNALAVSWAGGRPVTPPRGPRELRARAEDALRDAYPATRRVTGDEAQGLQQLARELRLVFVDLAEGREADAAARLNRMMALTSAVPHLHRTGAEPWHLHFHAPEAGFVQGWAAGCAVGLAYALSSGHAPRLGVCGGPRCERVFVDLSRNGSRRFCTTACQNRVKAASFRARRRTDRSAA